MAEPTWVVEINEELKSDVPSKHEWERPHSIYKVPLRVTSLNEKAYKPLVVSFGPYHNGEESLKNMEAHKHRALIHFLKRCKKPMELLYHRMDQVVDDLRDSYSPLDPIWMQDKSKFLKMMILDGCFLLEISRDHDDYANNDPIFGEHGILYVVPYVKRDMLMLENQLPLMVLRILIEIETDDDADQAEEKLMNQILTFFGTCSSSKTSESIHTGKYLHVLDVYRKTRIQQRPPKQKPCKQLWFCKEHDKIVRSATELQESGIRFKKSKTKSLRDVSFSGSVLRLPRLEVDDNTEHEFLNLIAFERLHVGAGNDVSSYVCFMDRIIDTEKDVALLHQKGILINNCGSDKVVAELFNSLSKEVVDLDLRGQFNKVNKCLSNYRKKPLKKWRANLIHTYFRSPWAGISLIAAIFLFALTIVQTIYTVAQYYQPPPKPIIVPYYQPPPRPIHHTTLP